MAAIKKVLDAFSKFTGMEVSAEKSKVIYSKGCSNRGELVCLVQPPTVDFSIKYLGMPLNVGKLRHHDC